LNIFLFFIFKNIFFDKFKLVYLFNLNFNLIIKLILTLLFFAFVVDTTLKFSKMNFFLQFISDNFGGFISTHHFISTMKQSKSSDVNLEWCQQQMLKDKINFKI
jgi:hypothetical protein